MQHKTAFFKMHSIPFLAFVLGLASIIGQVLLMRELIAVFYGNETAYAIILASWMFWVSLGSLLVSHFISRIKTPEKWLIPFLGSIAFILPATVIVSRCLKIIWSIEPGQIVGLVAMCAMAFFVLGPLTLLFGGFFSLVCRLNEQSALSKNQAGSTIYIWESVGAAAGGFLFSFVLIHLFSSLGLAFAVSLLILLVIMTLPGISRLASRVALAVAILLVICWIGGGVGKADLFSRQRQWRGFNLVASVDSVYGNLTLTKLGQDYSLFENGLLFYTTRDIASSEDKIHFPMLMHPQPRRVLLIGNGISGGLQEILKYPQASVDYVELDPMVIRLSQKYLEQEQLQGLRDPRVKVIASDGRWLVKRSREKYDVIILNLGDPYTAMINRYYTREFFTEASRVLNPNGILALSVSSSENYLSEDNRNFLRTINTTLNQVFPEVKSIPGDTHIFLASSKAGLLTLDHQELMTRLHQRGILTKYIREYYLPFRLSQDRLEEINAILTKPGQSNTDLHPIAYLYDIILWSTHFDTLFPRLIQKLQSWGSYPFLLILPLLILLVGGLLRRSIPAVPITLSIMTTGFSQIIFQLLVIFAFQSLYGYAYYKIGMIIASFMAGLVVGSLWARNMAARSKEFVWRVYLAAQAAICLYAWVIPLAFMIFRDAQGIQQYWQFFAGTFALLPLVAGLLGGLQYPLALRLIAEQEGQTASTARSAGILYGVDVFGASFGALVSGAILIPLLGIGMLAYICFAVNVAVLVLLLFSAPRGLRAR